MSIVNAPSSTTTASNAPMSPDLDAADCGLDDPELDRSACRLGHEQRLGVTDRDHARVHAAGDDHVQRPDARLRDARELRERIGGQPEHVPEAIRAPCRSCPPAARVREHLGVAGTDRRHELREGRSRRQRRGDVVRERGVLQHLRRVLLGLERVVRSQRAGTTDRARSASTS